MQMPERGALHGATRDAFRAQVLSGMPLGDGYYLRAFPVWFARRGNYGVLLSQAKALSAAAQLRRDRDAAQLAQQQAQWIVGRNPFVQSTMYGEGYDWAQQYSVSSGDFVGALPVGMQSRGNTDLPYWPAQNMYVYKEVWGHPVSRWLWLMRDIAGPAIAEGFATPGVRRVEFRDAQSDHVASVTPDARGAFRTLLPEGSYTINAGEMSTTRVLLAGGSHSIDLRPGRLLDFTLAAVTAADGTVTIRLTASGDGAHTFALRTDDVDMRPAARTLTLEAGRTVTVEWRGRVKAQDAPWVAVVVADGDVASMRRDVVGSLPRYRAQR
jgi:hypothetical protein